MSSALVDNLQAKSSALSARLLDAVELSEAYNAKIAAIDPADKDANSKIEALIVQRNEGYATAKAAVAAADKEYKDAIIEINNNGTSQDISECNVIVSAQTTFGTDVIKPRADAAKAAFIDNIAAKRAEIGTTSPESKPEPKVESPTAPTTPAEVKETLPPAESSVGVGTANHSTKVNEGLTSTKNKFGNDIPFSKPSAEAPKFTEMARPLAVAGSRGETVNQTLSEIVKSKGGSDKPQASAGSVNQATGATDPRDDKSHLVTLEDKEGALVEFLVMPEITEQRGVAYEPVAPPQFPGAFQKYKGTESVQWTINATFISRTSKEATENLTNLNILRGWTMPYFGSKITTSSNEKIRNKLGAPPPVLIFKGLRQAMIGPVPVVITSLNWSWPRDVDYIPAEDPSGIVKNVPFPTVMTVAINIVESFSTEQFNNFDLQAYRMGRFEEAFGGKDDGYVGNEDTIEEYAKLSKSVTEPAQVIAGAGNLAKDKLLKEETTLGICERKFAESQYVNSTVQTMITPSSIPSSQESINKHLRKPFSDLLKINSVNPFPPGQSANPTPP